MLFCAFCVKSAPLLAEELVLLPRASDFEMVNKCFLVKSLCNMQAVTFTKLLRELILHLMDSLGLDFDFQGLYTHVEIKADFFLITFQVIFTLRNKNAFTVNIGHP